MIKVGEYNTVVKETESSGFISQEEKILNTTGILEYKFIIRDIRDESKNL